MFRINLDQESAAVLLRCLSYGQNAISQKEVKSGVEKVIVENIELLRKNVSYELAQSIITRTSQDS